MVLITFTHSDSLLSLYFRDVFEMYICLESVRFFFKESNTFELGALNSSKLTVKTVIMLQKSSASYN